MRIRLSKKIYKFHWLDLIILALVGSVAFTLLTRVFSFFTLLHGLKVLYFAFIFLALLAVVVRFLRGPLMAKAAPLRKVLLSLALAIVATVGLLLLVDYRRVPVRTTHQLSLTNLSDTSRIMIESLTLPGDEQLDFAATFPDRDIQRGQLILQPGETISYSREMVGGVTLEVRAEDSSASFVVEWDGVSQNYVMEGEYEPIHISLNGASWGVPSLPYRLLGYASILSDGVSVFGGIFIFLLLILPGKAVADESAARSDWAEWLGPFTRAILINLVILIVAILYAARFDEHVWLLALLFCAGGLIFLRDLTRVKPQWLFSVVLVLLLSGSAVNGYFWINPPHELHQIIQKRPDNSFAYLADRIGAKNATYLSIGYYQYLRGSTLVITPPLYEELQLDEGRLRALNQLDGFVFSDYQDQLTDSQAQALLNDGEWEVWPNRTGGEYYLLPEISAPGDTYYFFSHGLQYFLIPQNAIQDIGDIYVSIFD